jgi:hypothetical protein
MEEPTMLTITKAAETLGISYSRLSDLINQEKIPYHDYNYPFVIKRTDLASLSEYVELLDRK